MSEVTLECFRKCMSTPDREARAGRLMGAGSLGGQAPAAADGVRGPSTSQQCYCNFSVSLKKIH